MRRSAATILVFLAGFAATATAGEQAAEPISFVSCPVYRDVDLGPKSGCWLATDPASGIRYDVGAGRSKPQWGREVLVEGIVSKTPNRCGGVVLEPVRIAVLDGFCNKHMLPAEGFPGRAFQLPAEVLQQTWVPRPEPQPPLGPRQFVIFFGFDSSFPLYQYSEIILEKAALYARASKPSRIVVTGYAATDAYIVSGRSLAEDSGVARARANKVALALERLGVPASIIKVQWRSSPEPVPGGDEGLVEPSKRRVVISMR
jgi:outer membrane protein OmpA-like peptidoglycan-associated protein